MTSRLYYGILLMLSLVFLLFFVLHWKRHTDTHITLIFVLVPIVNLGYVLFSRAQSLEAALTANRVIYIGGCYLLMIIFFAIYSLCDIPLGKWVRALAFLVSTVVYLSTFTMGKTPLFYKYVNYSYTNGTVVLIKEYGVMHYVFVILICTYVVLSLGAVVYSYFFKNQVSKINLTLILFPSVVAILSYFLFRSFAAGMEILPLVYVVALSDYLVILHRLSLYDITDSVIESISQSGYTGFISLDSKLRYLGSNRTARTILPALNELVVDRPIEGHEAVKDTLGAWLKEYRENPDTHAFYYDHGDRIYEVEPGRIKDHNRDAGYRFVMTDHTSDLQYVRLLNSYNSELQDQVKEKTQHIVEMHNNLILSMAMMVESRDNSTGGHIRRTSEGVRILIEEMRQSKKFELSDSFCADLIKAAPMHDLGKIAVDDEVLRKPGRFTPDEFEKMKAHAAEGARIVHEILRGTDDEEFKRIAENVAHYHHERWDGSGYPLGLKGEEIPFEARVMAVADVYDALVSKRVYKESMSFERADKIIREGMGSQFDPSLSDIYNAARPRLEAYYRSLEEV